MSLSKKRVTLTIRQTHIAVLLGRGFTGQEIGEQLGIGKECVKKHIRQARDVTSARNSTQLAVMVAVSRARAEQKRELAA